MIPYLTTWYRWFFNPRPMVGDVWTVDYIGPCYIEEMGWAGYDMLDNAIPYVHDTPSVNSNCAYARLTPLKGGKSFWRRASSLRWSGHPGGAKALDLVTKEIP